MNSDDNPADLARWLQEAARRRQPPLADLQDELQKSGEHPQPRKLPPWTRIRWSVYALITAIAYLQYFYTDVMLQINAIRPLIVLLFVNGMLPPV